MSEKLNKNLESQFDTLFEQFNKTQLDSAIEHINEQTNISSKEANVLGQELSQIKQQNQNTLLEEENIEQLVNQVSQVTNAKELNEVLHNNQVEVHISEVDVSNEVEKNNVELISLSDIDFSKNIIEARNLVKSFKSGVHEEIVLKNIDFNIVESAITTIVGPSGSGKTTILNILSGLDGATSGEVNVDGTNIIGMSEDQLTTYRLEKLGFIFQSYNLIADLNVRENVQISAELTPQHLDVDEILKLVGLNHASDKYPYQLSGGMQQRVSIARALVKNPKILVCDEPTGALDEKTGKDVLELLQNLCQKTKTTIILVTHNPGIKAMSHAVIEVKDGNIAAYYKHDKIVSAKDINWA